MAPPTACATGGRTGERAGGRRVMKAAGVGHLGSIYLEPVTRAVGAACCALRTTISTTAAVTTFAGTVDWAWPSSSVLCRGRVPVRPQQRAVLCTGCVCVRVVMVVEVGVGEELML